MQQENKREHPACMYSHTKVQPEMLHVEHNLETAQDKPQSHTKEDGVTGENLKKRDWLVYKRNGVRSASFTRSRSSIYPLAAQLSLSDKTLVDSA